jgi:hypothetical protein
MFFLYWFSGTAVVPDQAHQAAPKAQSDGRLNTMPFHKMPGLKKLFCGMTQRVLA